jgi:hypothetical protein
VREFQVTGRWISGAQFQQKEPTTNFPHDLVGIISFGKESYQYALLHTSPIQHEQTLHGNFYLDIPETIISKQLTLRYIRLKQYICLSFRPSVRLSVYLFMALQPFVEPWPFFQLLKLYTVGRTPWTGNQPVARPLPAHWRAHRRLCLKWDSNPRSQCLSGRSQFTAIGRLKQYIPKIRTNNSPYEPYDRPTSVWRMN